MSKNKNKIKQSDHMKVILMGCLFLFLIVSMICTIAKKEEPSKNSDNNLKVEIMENGQIKFDTTSKTQTITFQIKNNTKENKTYNIGLKEILNPLEEPSTLTYDLWLNDKQEIYSELFPKEDMLILDGASINQNDYLEGKLILKYETTNNAIENKIIQGKLTIEED